MIIHYYRFKNIGEYVIAVEKQVQDLETKLNNVIERKLKITEKILSQSIDEKLEKFNNRISLMVAKFKQQFEHFYEFKKLVVSKHHESDK